jgi:hypothetical protein
MPDPSLQRGSRTWLAAAMFIFATMALAARQCAHLPSSTEPEQRDWALADFRDVVYYPARAFLDGRNPYDAGPYMRQYPVGNVFPLYAPHLLLISAPLALLPYDVALAVFWVIGILAFPAFAALCLATCGIRVSAAGTLLLAAALLVSVPGRWTFDTGQLAVLISIGCVAAVHFAPLRPRLATLGLVLACVKPTFGIPVAILMFANGSMRVVLSAAVIVAASAAAVLGTFGAAPWIGQQGACQDAPIQSAPFCGVLVQNQQIVNADSIVDPQRSHTRTDGAVLLIQALDAPATPWTELAWFGLCMGVCGLILGRGPRAASVATPGAGVMLLATTLCVYHQTYDAVLLAPLLVWLVRDCLIPPSGPPQRVQFVVAALIAMPFINVFWSKIFLGLLQNSLGIANDTIMAISRSAGLINSVACCAAIVGMSWLHIRSRRETPHRVHYSGAAP